MSGEPESPRGATRRRRREPLRAGGAGVADDRRTTDAPDTPDVRIETHTEPAARSGRRISRPHTTDVRTETHTEPAARSGRRTSRRPAIAGLRPRFAPAAAVVMAVAVGGFVLAAAGAEPEPDPVVPVQPIVDRVRTETSAPRVETAAAGAPQPAPAAEPAPPRPLEPGGDLGDIVISDGVPSTGGYTDLIRTYFGSHTVEAIVIVQCESNFDPNAVGTNTNGTQDHGLFQINDVHMRTFEAVLGHPWDARYDPTLNTAFAAWLYDHAGGWGPWRCNRHLEQFDEAPGDDG